MVIMHTACQCQPNMKENTQTNRGEWASTKETTETPLAETVAISLGFHSSYIQLGTQARNHDTTL